MCACFLRCRAQSCSAHREARGVRRQKPAGKQTSTKIGWVAGVHTHARTLSMSAADECRWAPELPLWRKRRGRLARLSSCSGMGPRGPAVLISCV